MCTYESFAVSAPRSIVLDEGSLFYNFFVLGIPIDGDYCGTGYVRGNQDGED